MISNVIMLTSILNALHYRINYIVDIKEFQTPFLLNTKCGPPKLVVIVLAHLYCYTNMRQSVQILDVLFNFLYLGED